MEHWKLKACLSQTYCATEREFRFRLFSVIHWWCRSICLSTVYVPVVFPPQGLVQFTWMSCSALGLKSHWLSATSTVTLLAAATRKTQQFGVMYPLWVSTSEWVPFFIIRKNINSWTGKYICPSLSSASVKWWPQSLWGPRGGAGRKERLFGLGHCVQWQLGDNGGHGGLQAAWLGLR